jgi:competence protein ComEC
VEDEVSDVWVLALAASVWVGSLVPLSVPRPIGAVLVLGALAARRPLVLVAAALVLAAGLSAASWAGLDDPASATVRGEAVLASDPEELGPSVRVDLRIGHQRVEAWARGESGGRLRDRLAGEVVLVEGRLRPAGDAAARLAIRHVAARLDVTRVGEWRAGSPLASGANAARRTLERGASSLSPARRALLRGFLLGDDRDISAPVEADFRAAGLTHLLAVSGQNLAFVLAVAGPVLRRMQLRGRLLLSLSVIGFFAVLTRAEPSVLRASAMASIACWSAFSGRPISRLRVLALAVSALLLIDPMLARSVGFQLSVGASLGLALFAAPIASRLRGPDWLRESLAVTIAAQLGVAPVLLTTFGGMPVVTPLANLLSVPVAGPLTAWGMTAGLVAGVLGGPIAALLHLPTTVMVGWIQAVARGSARLPLGMIDVRAALAIAGVLVVARWWRRLAIPLSIAALLVLARPATADVDGTELAKGVRLWRDGAAVLVVDGRADPARVLDGLRRAGVGTVDLVVARRGSRDVAGLVVAVRSRHRIRAVAAPEGHRIRDATAVARPTTLHLGGLEVHLTPHGPVLDVRI